MMSTRKSLSLLAIAALASGLTACGDSGSDAGSSASPAKTTMNATSPSTEATASSSASASAGSGASSSGTSSGSSGVSDEAWASKYKKVVTPLADKSDAEVVAAGKKVCSDFTADPTPEGAKKVISDAEAAWKLDSVQANMWAGGAVAHFCNDKAEAFITASVG